MSESVDTEAVVQSAPPTEGNRYGHRYDGLQDRHGCAICSACGCRENTDESIRPCTEAPMPGDHPTAPRAGEERSLAPRLKLIASVSAFVQWARGVEGFDYRAPRKRVMAHAPAEYPCYAYTIWTDHRYEEQGPVYLYRSDLERLLAELPTTEANPLPGREHVASTAREGGENG